LGSRAALQNLVSRAAYGKWKICERAQKVLSSMGNELDVTDLQQQIPPKPTVLKKLSQRHDAPGLRRISAHLGLLVPTGAAVLAAPGGWWLLPAVVHGIIMVFLFAPLHETVHRTAFRSGWLNRAVGDLAGFVLILPPRWFAAFHFAHHRFTQDPARDPELASPKPTTLLGYVWVVSGIEYWQRTIRGLIRRAFGIAPDTFLDDRLRARAILEARVYLALYAALAIGSAALGTDLVLKLWVVPALLGQPFLRLYLLSEHWGCPSVKDMWANTRSTVSIAPVRWLAWNMPHHAEHHANPAIPFHALPAYSQLMKGARVNEERGYAPFHASRITDLSAGRAGPI
jgi:fatty acid desaturase